MTQERSFQPAAPDKIKDLAERESSEDVVDQQTAAAAAELEAEDHNAERTADERRRTAADRAAASETATNEGRLDRGADPAEGRR